MFPNKCKAILMTENNSILEYGEAKISLKNKTVDFVNSFVPLLPMSTMVKIICCENETNTHLITGNVYLSSTTLLRIDNINIKLFDGAEQVLTMEVSIPAKILEISQKASFFSVRTTKKWLDCTISSISAEKICFYTSWRKTAASNVSKIQIHQPVFPSATDISIKISGKPIIFGEKYKYIYSLTGLKEKERSTLHTFIRQYSTLIIDNVNSH
ncbi:MAG: hypothetical protein ACI4JM_04300 [Oscillospiraceae bacterium]